MFDLAVPLEAQGALGACGDAAVAIHEIQGRGRSSPYAGAAFDPVSVEAVVVGAFEGLPEGIGGFFLQEEDEDADDDAQTSEGLFVFTGREGVADASGRLAPRVGERVRVRGRVREYFGLTELADVAGWLRCSEGALPTAALVRLPRSDVADWERWEGMRVRLAQPLLVSGQHAALRFGELDLAIAHRPWQPTHFVAPGARARLALHNMARSRVLLDDGRRAVGALPPAWLSTRSGSVLRLGDRALDVEGVVDFAFGRFRIQPTKPVRLEAAPRRAVAGPPFVPGRLRVAAWNVANLFNGDGRGGGFPTRGAASSLEYARQLAKVVETLAMLDADIVALSEVENDGVAAGSAVADLVGALRARGLAYTAIDTGEPAPGHAIAVVLLYSAMRVEAEGRAVRLDGGVATGFDSVRNRPSVAQTFRHRATGESLTVLANHFKSKGSSCAAAGDPDLGDGQGECNATRRAAARAVVAWLASEPPGALTHSGARVLVLGDLNAYPREDPLAEFAAAGYVDVVEAFAGAQAYSFVFDGARGRLDHALASAALAERVTGAAVWNLNADESPALDYRADRPSGFYSPDPRRSSDHDPVLVGLFSEDEPDVVGPPRRRRGLGRLLRSLRGPGAHEP